MTSEQSSSSRARRCLRAALCGAAAIALTVGALNFPAWSANPPPANAAISQIEPERGYADLVAAVQPAVVNVSVQRTLGDAATVPEPFADPDMRRFFERFFGQIPDMPRPPMERRERGEGSGFIIDPAGLIVTNAHVVGNADKVEVRLHDGSRYDAKVRGIDEKTDLAVIEIKADRPLPYLTFGDSDQVRVGDKVVAIGNPFGLGGTVTAGIVSATNREIGSGPYEDFLQIDAPINRGNSGGPTFNLKGEVVGVNTAIFSPSGGSVGIGFAISSNLAKKIVADLLEDGRIERGWLGVSIQRLDRDIANSLKLAEPEGALVANVERGSPAEAADIRSGDVIVEFAGKPIKELRDLTRAVADSKAGTTEKLVVWRDGKRVTLVVKVGLQPTGEEIAAADEPAGDNQPRLGLALAPVPPEMREQLGITDTSAGVLVQRVLPNSPAEEKGLRPGDVIIAVGGTPVSSPKEVIDAVKEAHGAGAKAVLMLLQRNGRPMYEAVPFAAS
jgi:serine protease Do